MDLRGKKIIIVGLARSGVAAARFLTLQDAVVLITDIQSPEKCRRYLDQLPDSVQIRLGGHDVQDFLNADLVVLSPGVPASIEPVQAALQAGIPVWSEVELAARFLKGRFIGITGSNGKTTTTTLIGAVLKEAGIPSAVAGNIGTPLSSLLLEQEVKEDQLFVVELSSFQLETIVELHCEVALLLNITPDHLDRYATFRDYVEAKKRIFRNQTENDFAVINLDDPESSRVAGLVGERLFPFSRLKSLEVGVSIEGNRIVIRGHRGSLEVLPVGEVALPGSHNLENVLAAVAACYLVGTPVDAIARTLRTFHGVEHRLEWVRQLEGVDYYNDSKATNVDSALRALQSFDRPLIVIMGGLDKGGEFEQLVPELKHRTKLLILIGRAAARIETAVGQATSIAHSSSLEEAVRIARQNARPGDTVLLAPACASFDMFESYDHRGRVFKESVHALNDASHCCQEEALS